MKKVNKKLIKVIIGLIIIGLCILWMIYWIIIHWPVITGEMPYGLGLKVMEVMGPLSGMILGGLLVFLGIESKKLRGLFLIISSSILIGLIIYDFLVISLLIDFSNFFLLLHFPIVMLIFGFIFLFEKHRKPIIKESIVKKVEAASNVSYKLRKPTIKESIGTKMEAAPNVTYMLRIDKEIGNSRVERISYICGYCGVKNNLKTIDEEHGIFQCLNCGAENHIIK